MRHEDRLLRPAATNAPEEPHGDRQPRPQIAARRHPLVVLLDYWSVWLGGKYAAARGDAYVAAADDMTGQVNAVIRSTATESGSAYVDLRAAFKGPSYTYDETHYLSKDGDHPNKAGHEKIATATEAVIEHALAI